MASSRIASVLPGWSKEQVGGWVCINCPLVQKIIQRGGEREREGERGGERERAGRPSPWRAHNTHTHTHTHTHAHTHTDPGDYRLGDWT